MGERYLVGLAVSHNLSDLRLADLINDALMTNLAVRVDVFNVDGCHEWADLREYFPDFRGAYHPTPIVGFWSDRIHRMTRFGFAAREFILRAVGSSISAEESVRGLNPPDRALVEG